jgi:hypothetical protein
MFRVALKTFTFEAGSKFLSIDNPVLGTLPKRLLFTMLPTPFRVYRQTLTPINSGISVSTTL